MPQAGDTEPDWRRLNRANWDERVAVHLGPRGYDLSALRAGRGHLGFVEQEFGTIHGLKILHLQCHVGTDSLALAQRGASVTGVDFSGPAIQAARTLAAELNLSDRARFVQADIYDIPNVVQDRFNAVFTTWGTTCWLPDLTRWAQIIVQSLKPAGFFYFADGHPAALVFDDRTGADPARPGFFWLYFACTPLIETDSTDYSDPESRLTNATTHQWNHPLSDVITALLDTGLRLDWLHEHDHVPWRMFACLIRDETSFYRWPDRPWLPLAFSLRATKTSPKPETLEAAPSKAQPTADCRPCR
jgi:SAM-dependent methyltransferase